MSPCFRKCKNLGKRLLMVFIPTPAFAFVPEWDWAQSIYYVTASVILSTGAILLNFPKIIHFLHGKSVSYEDLEDEHAVEVRMKRRFQRAFEVTITATLAILMAALIDYYLDRFDNTELSTLEILGVIGGFISLLHKIEDIIGKMLLVGLHCYKTEFSPRPSVAGSTPPEDVTLTIPDIELGQPAYPFDRQHEIR